MKTKLILLFSLILFASCASSGVDRKPSKPRNFISFEEVQSLSGAFTAKDVVMLSRPFWLRGVALAQEFEEPKPPTKNIL